MTKEGVGINSAVDSSLQVLAKDLLIQQKEKLYVEMQDLLARHPNPEEAAEQLNTYSRKLAEKTKQLKAMSSELRLYQATALTFTSPQCWMSRHHRTCPKVSKRNVNGKF